MDKDNYEIMCEIPQIGLDMGLKKSELKKICRELKKDDIAHLKMEREIEKSQSARKEKQ